MAHCDPALASRPPRVARPARCDRHLVGDHVRLVIDDLDRHALHQAAEALLAFEQCALGGTAIGEVAGDLGIADELAGGVADRVHHRMRPKVRAVLANAPAFGLESPDFGGGAQDVVGQARGAVVRQEESRIGPADDLVRLIALEAARPGVPGGDRAVGVDHVDGIIDHRVDQHLEALFLQAWGRIGHGAPAARDRYGPAKVFPPPGRRL